MMNEKKYVESTRMCFWALIGIGLMLIAALFSSCGSHRSNMKQDTSTENVSGRQRKDSTSADKKVQITESDKATESAESYEVNYDTDKPVDPVTGKPPVKSEKWSGKKKESEHNQQTNIDNKQNSVSDDSSFSRQKDDKHLQAEEQKDEPTTIKQIGYAGAGIALLIISCIIAWLVYKKKRKKNNE